ncbi:hypothetical protein ACO0QE_002203 [Hanseniaspora vineae]
MVQERKIYSKLPSSSKKSYGSRFNPNSEHVASTQEKKSRFARETKQNGPNTYLGSNTPSSTGSANEQPKKRESGNSATLSRNPDRETDTRRNRTNLSSSYRPSASNNASAEVPPVTLVLSGNHRLIFYSSDLEILHQSINLSEKCTSLNWHPSGKMLHVGTPDGECLIYSEEASVGWALKTTLDISHSAVTSIVCDTRGQLILFASSDGNLQVFSLENYTKINSFESENGYAILSLDLT